MYFVSLLNSNFFVSYLSVLSWDISPVMFSLGPISVRWYGFLFALCFIAAYYMMSWVFKKEGKSMKSLDSLTIYIIAGTVLGARLGHCLFYSPEYYLTNPIEILMVWKGGLASHGAAIGILTGIYLFSRWHKEFSFIWLFDRLAITIPLSGAFVRLGNFFNSEIIGMPAQVPWAVVFKSHDLVPRHPAQLYESLSYLAIFALLAIYYSKNFKNLVKGRISGIFLIMLFSARFIIEFIKEDQSAFEAGMLINMGQLLSLPFIIGGIYLLLRKSK